MVRAQPTKLEGKRLGKAYRGRLSSGLDLVLRWLLCRDPVLMTDLNDGSIDLPLLDQLLAEFVSECWELQLSFSLSKHAILGMQTRYRRIRGFIPRAWDCIGVWEARREHRSRSPIDVKIVDYLFAVCVSWACDCAERACSLYSMAVLMKLAFYGLMRPGEFLSLRAEDVSISSASDVDQYAVLAVKTPKHEDSAEDINLLLFMMLFLSDGCAG